MSIYIKTFILTISAAFILVAAPLHSVAGSATWGTHPPSGDWNSAENWVPNTVPNGAGDVATFDMSDVTSLSINTTSIEVSNIVFNRGADPFTITVDGSNGFVGLDITGSGIINNSGVLQTLICEEGTSMFFTNGTVGESMSFVANGATLSLVGTASAAAAAFVVSSTSLPAHLAFSDASTAAEATITVTNGGQVLFSGSTTADNAQFVATARGSVLFGENSSADHAVATFSGASFIGSGVGFTDNSTAAQGSFTANGAVNSSEFGAIINFSGDATAGEATFVLHGGSVQDAPGAELTFFDDSTAANATITANGGVSGGEGSLIIFQSRSKGGTATISLLGNGAMDISNRVTVGLTIGSLSGNGLVFLGSQTLTLGSKNRSTAFSGVIQDGGISGRTGGSLNKIGSGNLQLRGTNTYTSGTTVSEGGLVINNNTGSGTGEGPVQVNAGTLAGRGNIAGAVTLGSGSGPGALLAPSLGAGDPVTLMIQSQLTFKADASYTWKVNTKKRMADQVAANGVTIENGAQFEFKAVANERLRRDTVFTAITNNAAGVIAGQFANLPDDSTVRSGRNSFRVDYQGGDGNDLTLTVVP